MAKPITTSNSINQIGRKFQRFVPEEEKLQAFFKEDKSGETRLLYELYERQKNNRDRD